MKTIPELPMIVFVFCRRPILPEYLLDFGYVVSRLTVSKRVLLTNIGLHPVSLSASLSSLVNTGFTTTLSNKIKDLPPGEAIDFTVQFDPVSVNGTLGHTGTVLPLQVQCICTTIHYQLV